MRILIDLTSLYDHISGIERYALEISKGLIKTHPENEYVLLFKNEVYEDFRNMENDNIRIHVLKARNKLIFSQLTLPVFLYSQKADAYLFMAFPEPLLFFRENVYTTVHDMSPWECSDTMKSISKWYFRLSWRHSFLFSKVILTVSKFSASRIMELANVKRNRIWLIRDGISGRKANAKDIEIARKKYNLPEKYIMTLSTIEPRKNMSLLVRAYSELIDEGYKLPELVLVGRNGWKNDKLFAHCSEEAREHIHMPGYIDNKETVGVYGGAQAFIFPSIYEGFGMPPLEAMLAGTIVVSSDAASMPEVLGDSAIYFKSDDVADLKNKIIYALELDGITRNEYLIKGSRRAELYKWDDEADKLGNRLATAYQRKR